MNHVRIVGDPFGEDAAASQLRSFVRQALAAGLRPSLSLAAVQPRPPAPGERTIPLTDGVRDLATATALPPAEVELLLRAAGNAVAATAPVLVFAAPEARADLARETALLWPQACLVLPVRCGVSAGDLVERVRAELRWAGTESPVHGCEERQLAPWLALPPLGSDGPIVAIGRGDFDGGLDLVIEFWQQRFALAGPRLRLVLPANDLDLAAALRQRLQPHGDRVEVSAAGFEPAHARDAAAIVVPWRRGGEVRDLVLALASGRPVCVARAVALAPVLARHGICLPIGGHEVAATPAELAHFAPDAEALAAAVAQALGDTAAAAAMGRRARDHVFEELLLGRPAAPAPACPARSSRPVVVLEAPWFETSSSAELSLATAKALQQRGRVDLRLVNVGPMRTRLAELRNRAPELEPLLCRDPGPADLYLASGWPVRSVRPPCRHFALRVDWEYGALPIELMPHVTQTAEVVVVHSEHVRRTVAAAGRSRGLVVVPHGVDATMTADAPPDPDLLAWKGELPAVLFCGGLIWRKGIDVFLRAVLMAWQAGCRFAVVVKSVGHDQHYGRFHLGELVERFARTPGAPPLRTITAELSRAELASTYTACDLLLHPYRGEGFGLPVLEARACGLPVLATAGGATDAVMAGPGGIRLPAQRRAIELPGAHAGQPWVLEPDGEAAGAALIAALRELPALRQKARAFAPSVRAAYGWDAAAAAIEALAFAAVAPANAEPLVKLPQTPPRTEPVAGAARLQPTLR
jgi:glycosyltransferase involved in cell wall biosynthesis